MNVSDKINQICRVCLSEDSLMMYSVFHKNCMNLEIASMIMCCASVKISAGDGLPELLCSSCLERLETAYSFKQECEESGIKLRSLLDKNMNSFENNEDNSNFKSGEYQSISSNSDSFDSDKLCADSMVRVELNILENEEIKFEDDQSDEEVPQRRQYNLRNSARKENNITVEKKTKALKKATQNKVTYNCNLCKKTFLRHNRYWRHRKIHPCYSCYVCWKRFDSLELLEEHGEDHKNKIYVCDQDTCDLQFTDCKMFVLHKKNDHKLLNYLHCLKCEKSFSTHEKWDLHVQKHLRNQTFECKICQKRFTQKCYVNTHMKVHSKKYKCNQCDKSYTTAQKLQVHSLSHAEENRCLCQDCGKKFVHKYNLERHINVAHNGLKPPKREKKHLCSHCGQIFARPIDLTIHMRLHTGVKPFSCDQCEYRCHDKQLLRSHIRVHTGMRPYKCSYCGKSFGSRSYLTIHERFHSGYRPYICSKCQKGFTNSKDLKVHERTHTGIKLFSCNICHNSFTTLHYLRVHTKKHDTQ